MIKVNIPTGPASSEQPEPHIAREGGHHDMPSSFASEVAASDAAAAPASDAAPQHTPPYVASAASSPSHASPAQASPSDPQPHASQPHASQPHASQPHASQPHASHPTPGAAFGIPAPVGLHNDPANSTQPTVPLDSDFSPASQATPKQKEKKPFGAGKVAALVVAAALVGGAAGLGTSYIGNTVWAQPGGSAASGPDSITVNNPGSVNETTAIATEVLPSVVTIQVAGQNGSGNGSGVVLSKDGYVLTNTHVVTLGGAEADPTIRVTTSDGTMYDATIVGTDPIYDLAVIKLEGAEDLKPIEFADSSEINVGSTAVAVGAPLGLSNSVTTGIVSALNRSIQIASSALPESGPDSPDEQESDQEGGPFQFDLPGTEQQQATESISIAVIQTDAAINPGNSGGALVDSEGKLIGINVAIATAGSSEESGSIGVGFAIPSNVAERISQEIIEDGAATHGLLGASVRDAASVADASVAGAYIVETTPDGGAAEAGLKEGDIVTSFNGA
ncbi:trypsin-like peptidase domain-containing protein, partial [Microbacterium sp.]|uniref:S1C family serine protease n=1 Tax=Microbacterium sp. TaxID=51671 RepID=UPI002627C352